MPRLKLYPEDLPGVPLSDVWVDIPPIHNLASERLGYPTQKPLALLERIGRGFVVRDLPWTEEQLRKIPHFEFENWAVIALGGIPNKAQVGDMGIDGLIYPVSATPKKKKDELEFMDVWYPIQVEQKDKVGRPDIDAFEAVMIREDRQKGFFVSFDYSQDALSEIQGFFKKTGRSIVALTVKDILDEQIALKLASFWRG